MEFKELKKLLNDESDLQIMDATGMVLGYYGASDLKNKLVVDIDTFEELEAFEVYPVNNYTLGVQIDYDYKKRMNKIDDYIYDYFHDSDPEELDSMENLFDDLSFMDVLKTELESYFNQWSIEVYDEDFKTKLYNKFTN